MKAPPLAAAAACPLLLLVLLALVAFHLWFFDMGAELRTQFMLGDSDERGLPTPCELDTRPLASRLDTVRRRPPPARLPAQRPVGHLTSALAGSNDDVSSGAVGSARIALLPAHVVHGGR